MIRSTRYYDGALAAAPRPMVLRVVRRGDQVVISRRHSQRPAWFLLYTILFLALAMLLTIGFLLPEGLGHSLADVLAVSGCIGLTRVWIGANRWSLARASGGQPRESASEVNGLSEREAG